MSKNFLLAAAGGSVALMAGPTIFGLDAITAVSAEELKVQTITTGTTCKAWCPA
jgi:hypothetical protein